MPLRTLSAALLVVLLLQGPAQAQEGIASAGALVDSLEAIGGMADASDRTAALDALWDDLLAAERVPFAAGTDVAFLWRGPAGRVQFAGDHTGWQPEGADRIAGTDVWVDRRSFPAAARVDYKVVVDGDWRLDPSNPHQQWGGFGPNSELRMPAWTFPEDTVRGAGVPAGTLTAWTEIVSGALGQTLRYRVWTPAGYAPSGPELASLYVTDGTEYVDDRLGALVPVLDNLTHDGRAEGLVVVFVSAYVSGANQRVSQYVGNPDYITFLADELVPEVQAAYAVADAPDRRGILGTSLGGLVSVYAGLQRPDTFGRLAVQSPAFWVTSPPRNGWTGASIYDRVRDAGPNFDPVVHMTTGTIRDTESGARAMRDRMQARGLDLTYAEVPEGHSWGNWRALLDDMLVTLFPGPAVTSGEGDPAGALPGVRLTVHPNPAGSSATLTVDLDRAQRLEVDLFDLQGRRLARLAEGDFGPGQHPVRIDTAGLAAGVYVGRVQAEGQSATVRFTRR